MNLSMLKGIALAYGVGATSTCLAAAWGMHNIITYQEVELNFVEPKKTAIVWTFAGYSGLSWPAGGLHKTIKVVKLARRLPKH